MASAIRFENVSKKFILHDGRPRSFQEMWVGLLKRERGRREAFWALRDVDFTVEQGDTVGLMGPNGAGKSTALKLVAGVLEPTAGRVTVRGRVGALLELGAGFHGDLTGRDNVYLNGSLMGLSRAAIDRCLDEIVAFAELERFIDVPVKHYSSGMYVRLGFSVAVHTDPEVLLIDEVLAVGDQSFQDKCMRQIKRLQDDGVTILFVSHGLDLIERLCRQALWIDAGRVAACGPAGQVAAEYLNRVWQQADEDAGRVPDTPALHGRRWGSGEAVITDVEFCDADGRPRRVFQTGETWIARIHYDASCRIERPAFGVALYRDDDVHVNGPNTTQAGYPIPAIEGRGTVSYCIPELPLLAGRYEFTAAIYDYHSVHPYDHRHRMYDFEVQTGAGDEREGLLHIPCRWEHSHG